jgi:hypothetical protein
MWPWFAGPAPDCLARIQAGIAGQLAPVAEAADVTDGGHERRGDDHVDPRDAHQPLDLRPGQRLGGDQPVDLRDLAVEELDLAHGGIDRLALGERELLPGRPGPARPLTPIRSDAGGRSFKQRINTAWTSFFARERARTS